MKKSVRASFEKTFGKVEADRIVASATEHGNGINNKNLGSDPFKWALLICIGYQCFEIPSYRKHHGIKASFKRIKQWIIDEGKLSTHDGDCDYLCMLGGGYNDYIKKRRKKKEK